MVLSYKEIRIRCLKADEASKPLYARLVTHLFSTRLIWLIQGLPLTPNHLTFVSLALALLALPFFAAMTPASVFLGALLIELYYVFDAVDGQWARLKDQKSLTGAFFDYLINYAIQPPLLFAIGWGVFRLTADPAYLLLGFLAGFSTLWVILIWNLRASVLLSHLAHAQKIPARTTASASKTDRPRSDFLRETFGWSHKLMVFPWFMYVLTLSSVACYLIERAGFGDITLPVFRGFVTVYGLGGPAIAAFLTSYWILTKKIDHSPELG